MPKPTTHAAAKALADEIQAALEDAGIPKDLVRVSAHEDVRDGQHHQTYIHIEAWAPGPALVKELDAQEAARKDAAAAAQKAAKKPGK